MAHVFFFFQKRRFKKKSQKKTKKTKQKKGSTQTERKKKDKANGAEEVASVFFRLLLAAKKSISVFRRVTSFRTHLTLLRTMSALSMTTAVAARVSIAGKSVASKRNATASPSKRGQLVRAQLEFFFSPRDLRPLDEAMIPCISFLERAFGKGFSLAGTRGKREWKRASRIRVKACRVSSRATGKTRVFVRVGAKKGPFARALRLFIALISKIRGREGTLEFQRDE